jgi:ketosteroid isomerase-like protein
LVQRGYEAFGRGDIGALLALLDENVEWITPGPSDLPTAGHRRGQQQVAEFFQGVNNLFEVQRFEPEVFVSEGDRVVVLGSETTRVKATGDVLDMRWAHVFTVRNGKVAVFEEYQDMSAVVAELRGIQSRT